MYNSRPPQIDYLTLPELGADIFIKGELQSDEFREFNPSIAWHGGQLKIALRSCNFSVHRHGQWYLRDGSAYSKTDVIYGDLDPNSLNVSNLKKLNLSKDSPTRTLVAGLEDVRLFSREDGLHAIGFESDRLTKSLHNSSTSLAEYLIDGDELKYLRTLEKPEKEAIEKNWSPTDIPSKEFDFTYSPTQVWKDGKVIGKPYTGNIHGGSQLIKQKGGTYLSLVHEKIADKSYGRVYDKYIYSTYLAHHDESGKIIHLSMPFNFGTHENIEFASGMVEYKDYFIISLGIRDVKFAIAKIKQKKLIDLLEPYIEL